MFSAVLPGNRYNMDGHHLLGRSHLFADPTFSEGESILQVIIVNMKKCHPYAVCSGFVFILQVVTAVCKSLCK